MVFALNEELVQQNYILSEKYNMQQNTFFNYEKYLKNIFSTGTSLNNRLQFPDVTETDMNFQLKDSFRSYGLSQASELPYLYEDNQQIFEKMHAKFNHL
jgi:hypothetical protein